LMVREIAPELEMVRTLNETDNASLVCLRMVFHGRRWVSGQLYRALGEQGLQLVSRRPHHSSNCKLTDQYRSTILRLRGKGNGAPGRVLPWGGIFYFFSSSGIDAFCFLQGGLGHRSRGPD
jgi:hypothetical protein